MATSKTRTNITLDDELDIKVTKLAERDDVPKATKAAQLIKLAVEIDEDDYLNMIAEERDTKGAKFVSHDQAWS